MILARAMQGLGAGAMMTCVFRKGMPAILATRGLFFAAYVSTQNFLVLALIDVSYNSHAK